MTTIVQRSVIIVQHEDGLLNSEKCAYRHTSYLFKRTVSARPTSSREEVIYLAGKLIPARLAAMTN